MLVDLISRGNRAVQQFSNPDHFGDSVIAMIATVTRLRLEFIHVQVFNPSRAGTALKGIVGERREKHRLGG